MGAAIARIVLNRARGLRGGFARRVVDDGRGVGDCGVACVCVCVCDRARAREMTDVCVRARVVFGDESAVGAAESARAKGETG